MFVDQSSAKDEIDAARRVLGQAGGSADKTQFIPDRQGVHGSATLHFDRNPAGAEENWAAVLAFLAKFKSAR